MFSNVLMFLDDPQGNGYFPHIISLAKRTNASFTLLGYPQASETSDPVDWHLSKLEAEIELEHGVKALQEAHVTVKGALLDSPAPGSLAQALARKIVDTRADLLILGESSRHLLLDPVLTDTGVTLHVLSSETALQGDQPRQIRKILVPLDCSLRAECVLPVVRQFSQMMKAHVLLAHVVAYTDMPPRLEHNPHISSLVNEVVAHKRSEGRRYLTQVQSSLPEALETRLIVNNHISQALHDLAAQEAVDMVILSAHGSSGNISWPYGSVTHSFIAYSKLPLLIIQDGSSSTNTHAWQAEMPAVTRPNHVAR